MLSPIVIFAAIFSLGIIVEKYLSVPLWANILFCLVFLAVTFYAGLKKLNLIFFIYILAFLAGLLNLSVRSVSTIDPLAKYVDKGYVQLTGEVRGDWRADNSSFPLTISGETITVYLNEAAEPVNYGDRVRVGGTLTESVGYANPLLLPGQHYRSFLATDHHQLSSGGGNLFFKLAFFFKHHFNLVLSQVLPPEQGELLGSILLGSSVTPISAEKKEVYRSAGLIHLLVVSGTQVSILIGVCLSFCRFLKMPLWPAVIGTSLFNLMLVLVTGGGASIMRAGIMGEIALIGLLFEREKETYAALALSALILLVIDPNNIFNIGFQLSFAATLGLVYVAPALGKGLLATSLAPLLTTSPLIFYYFSQLSPGALLANLLVLPWLEFLVILGFATILTGFIFMPLAQIFGGTLWLLLLSLDLIAKVIAGLPGAIFYLPAPSWPLIAGYYVFLLVAIGLAKRGNFWRLTGKRALIICCFAAMILVWHLAAAPAGLGPSELTVTFLDVGQGDCALIETPSGGKILVDGGGKESADTKAQTGVGEKVVVPFLRRKGINKLSLVVLTHPHLDHFGGLIPVLEKIKVAQLIDNGGESNSPAYRRFRRLVEQNRIKYQRGILGQVLDLGGSIKGEILHPAFDLKGEPNTDSLVIRLLYGKISFMLTGDLDQQGEEEMLGLPLASTVLKVGHHGSRTSTSDEFLDRVKPRIAVISAGRRNRFRHPHQSTLKKLAARGIRTYRTDLNGAVVVATDGRRVKVSTGR